MEPFRRNVIIVIWSMLSLLSASVQSQQHGFKYYSSKVKELYKTNPDSAFYYAQHSLLTAKNKAQKAYSFYALGYTSKYRNMLNKAEAYYKKSLLYADERLRKKIYTTLANTYLENNESDKAVQYTQNLFDLQLNDKEKSYACNVRANIYRNSGNFNSASVYYKKALALKYKLSSGVYNEATAEVLWDYAQMYFLKSKHLTSLNKPVKSRACLDTAIRFHNRILAIRKRNPTPVKHAIANSYTKEANYYYIQKNYWKALLYADSSLAVSHTHLTTKLEALSNKASILQALGQQNKAYAYYQKADSLAEAASETPGLNKSDQKYIKDIGREIKRKFEYLAGNGIKKSGVLQKKIRYLTAITSTGLLVALGVFFAAFRYQASKVRKKEEKQRTIINQKMDVQKVQFQKLLREVGHRKNELDKENRLLEHDTQRLKASKQIELLSELSKFDVYSTAFYEIENALNLHKDTPKWVKSLIVNKIEKMKKCDHLMLAVATAYPYFVENLIREIDNKGIIISQPKHVRLAFLLIAKKHGVDNDFIAKALGYTKPGIKSAKNILAHKFGYTSTVDFEEYLMTLAKKRPELTVNIEAKTPKKASGEKINI